MSIRLDPRRLSALKLLAAEAGVRPGELVTAWVEERLDAARAGRPAPVADAASTRALADLAARLDELSARVDALADSAAAAAVEVPPPDAEPDRQGDAIPEAPAPKRRGRPRKAQPAESEAPAEQERSASGTPRVPLHEEIAAVIGERGPSTAAEIATAIAERGRYAPPRSSRPLDAATVNSRVSNPAYRARFTRTDGRIGLA